MKKYSLYIGLTIGEGQKITLPYTDTKGLTADEVNKLISKHINPNWIRKQTKQYFNSSIEKGALKALNIEGYTLVNGSGNWQGQSEQMIIVSILSSEDITEQVKQIAEGLKGLIYQNSIMIEVNNITQIFV